MKHFQINNLKSAAMKCLEEIETNMGGLLMKIFHGKQ